MGLCNMSLLATSPFLCAKLNSFRYPVIPRILRVSIIKAVDDSVFLFKKLGLKQTEREVGGRAERKEFATRC